MEYVRTLKNVHRGDGQLVGERAVDLALLEEKEYAVPPTSVLTNEAFEAFVVHNRLQQRIAETLENKDAGLVYGAIRELLIGGSFPQEIVQEIVDAYESLGVEDEAKLSSIVAAKETPFVNVMLSPNYTCPPESNEGFILNVRGLEELLLAVKEAWACLFTPTMQGFRREAGLGHRNLNAGVLVQQMALGEATAEAWSATGQDTEQLTVKTYYGAPDIGSGVEKDEFRLTREYLKPTYQSVAAQTFMLARDEEERLGKAPLGARGEEQKLNDRVVIEVGRLAKKASQVLDCHVRVFFSVTGERVRTLLCNRLLLTKGSVRLQGYQAEEPIAGEVNGATVTERAETTLEVDDETDESEVVAHEEALSVEPGDTTGPIPAAPEAEAAPTEEEPAPEETEEAAEPDEQAAEAAPEEETEDAGEPAPEDEAEEAAEETVEEGSGEAGAEEETEQAQEETPEAAETHDEQAESIFGSMTEEEGADETGAEEEKEREETQEETSEAAEPPAAKPEEPAAEQEGAPTLAEARTLVVEALTKRYEGRFRNQPPEDVKQLFEELRSEVIIPHEELIARLIAPEEADEEQAGQILDIIDDFLDKIR